MELSYWESRWRKGNIGFHMPEGYPELKKQWKLLQFPTDTQIFVPLCGKSEDMIWLASRCKSVTGSEISEKAVHTFFSENGLEAESVRKGDFTIYRSNNITIWQGDFFKIPPSELADTDLIYDKAALVALPPETRKRYARRLSEIGTSSTAILLHHFVYDQNDMNGPPFSVPEGEVEQLFGDNYQIDELHIQSLNTENFKKFRNRGLSGLFRERFLYLRPINR
ncbi:MAG: thiopurine S-methyltransferase [Balneolaceae bacterium]|nr:thiopurine S-methyltransferase [Balneolaceae bacterium]MCH8549504.1 thiopurine S-methyltransferase [Balneolaceae bacterium]